MVGAENIESLEENGPKGPRVSVLIYVSKDETDISDCVKSLHNQILDDLDVMFIVHEDNEIAIDLLKNYAKNDARIKLIRCKIDDYGKVLNQGIKHAKGEYISVLNPNDFVDPEMYIELFAMAKKYDADIVKSNYFEIINGQEMMHEAITQEEAGHLTNPAEDTRIFYEALMVGTGIYRKSFIIEKSIGFLEGRNGFCQEVSFEFKALVSTEKVISTDKPYLHVRSNLKKISDDIFRINDEFSEIEEFLKEQEKWDAFGYIFQVTKFGNYNWIMTNLPKEKMEKFLLRMRAEFHDADNQDKLIKGYFPKRYWKALKAILLYPPQAYLTMFKTYSKKKVSDKKAEN